MQRKTNRDLSVHSFPVNRISFLSSDDFFGPLIRISLKFFCCNQHSIRKHTRKSSVDFTDSSKSVIDLVGIQRDSQNILASYFNFIPLDFMPNGSHISKVCRKQVLTNCLKLIFQNYCMRVWTTRSKTKYFIGNILLRLLRLSFHENLWN